ncbi:MAG: hypothetical protein ACI9H6_000580 [Patiriisocius sp.]|jgi:hypothetical protein
MINLIPPQAKKQVKVEYTVRAISMLLVLFTAALVIVGVLLVPTYVLIHSQLITYEAQYSEITELANSYEELEKAVTVTNIISTALMTAQSELLFSDIVTEIQTLAVGNVELESFRLSRTEGLIADIQVSGEARSRASLVAFRDALEEDELFESAALPLSNLAKDVEIPFNISIVMASAVSE